MRRQASGIIVCAWVGLAGAGLLIAVQARVMPAAWPYAQPQLPPGVIPPQAAAPRIPPATPVTPPDPNAPAPALRQAFGSTLQFTPQQVSNGYGPADWFPNEHPPMPDIVAHGTPGVARACGLCHLPNGRGRPENAPKAVVANLNDSDIVDLVAFVSSLDPQ